MSLCLLVSCISSEHTVSGQIGEDWDCLRVNVHVASADTVYADTVASCGGCISLGSSQCASGSFSVTVPDGATDVFVTLTEVSSDDDPPDVQSLEIKGTMHDDVDLGIVAM